MKSNPGVNQSTFSNHKQSALSVVEEILSMNKYNEYALKYKRELNAMQNQQGAITRIADIKNDLLGELSLEKDIYILMDNKELPMIKKQETEYQDQFQDKSPSNSQNSPPSQWNQNAQSFWGSNKPQYNYNQNQDNQWNVQLQSQDQRNVQPQKQQESQYSYGQQQQNWSNQQNNDKPKVIQTNDKFEDFTIKGDWYYAVQRGEKVKGKAMQFTWYDPDNRDPNDAISHVTINNDTFLKYIAAVKEVVNLKQKNIILEKDNAQLKQQLQQLQQQVQGANPMQNAGNLMMQNPSQGLNNQQFKQQYQINNQQPNYQQQNYQQSYVAQQSNRWVASQNQQQQKQIVETKMNDFIKYE